MRAFWASTQKASGLKIPDTHLIEQIPKIAKLLEHLEGLGRTETTRKIPRKRPKIIRSGWVLSEIPRKYLSRFNIQKAVSSHVSSESNNRATVRY